MGKIFSISEDEINRVSSRLSQIQTNLDNAVGAMSNSLENLNSSGLFNTTSFEKGIKSTTSYIASSQYKLNKLAETLFNGERVMYAKVNTIETPQDFVKNDDMPYNNIDDIELSENKEEGIKSNNYQEKLGETADSVVEEEKLKSILKKDTEKTEEIDASGVEKEELKDIEKEETEKANELEDSTLEKEKLVEVKKEQTEKVEEIENNSVSQDNIGNIYKRETEKIEEIENNTISQENIGNVYSGGTEKVEEVVINQGNSSKNEEKKDNDKSDEEEFMKSYSMYEEYMKNKQNEKDGEESSYEY